MAKSRQKPKQSKPSAQSSFWLELQDNFTREGLGILLFVAGGYFGFSLLVAGEAAWIARTVGWTAGLVALALLILGIVLMMGERAGYWNPQALVGAELVLLGLQTGAFLVDHAEADWTPPVNSTSGWLGWALGNLLVAGLGRWPALLLIAIMIAGGGYLLFRHTPLIYLTPYFAALTPMRYRDVEEAAPARRSLRPTQSRSVPPSPVDPMPLPTQTEPPAASSTSKRRSATPSDAASAATSASTTTAPPAVAPAIAPAIAPDPAQPARAKPPQPTPSKLQVLRPPDRLPAIDLLESDSGRYGSRDTKRTEEMIEQTLADFNIPVRIVNVESGPTVTQYGVEPLYTERAGQRRKVRVSRIVNLADDLALALAAPSVRIEAPVPGHPYVGIEVPNHDKIIVGMRGILESPEMGKRGGMLPVALGRDTAGAPVVTDLTRAPHLLIAGATGSGKSVCVNAIIISLLMHHGPDSLRFVMVDPKMVELPGYNGIPHLIGKVITEVDQVVGALTWLLLQMDDRYGRFRDAKVRNIGDYNAKAAKSKDLEALPYLVLVVDELADLMMTAPEDVERQLVRLAQMARATGIHMILATQRPSTDVVTGLIKANFPTRIAFAVTSQIDSRVVLDSNGAEKLLGQGDMLFMSPSAAKLSRVQGCWVSDKEIERVVKFWQEQERLENPNAPLMKVAPWIGILDQLDDEEELLNDVIDLIRDQETVTTSFVQKKLRIGYPKAARMMDQLEAKGLVGPDQGGGQGRVVKIKKEEESEEEE